MPQYLVRVWWWGVDEDGDDRATLTHLAVADVSLTGLTSGVTLCGRRVTAALEGESRFRPRVCSYCREEWRRNGAKFVDVPRAGRLATEYMAVLRDFRWGIYQ